MPDAPERVSPWEPITDRQLLKRLGKLAEEAGELGAAVARTIIQGDEGTDPKSGKTNRRALEEEIADVIANAELLVEYLSLDTQFIEARIIDKRERQKIWMEM